MSSEAEATATTRASMPPKSTRELASRPAPSTHTIVPPPLGPSLTERSSSREGTRAAGAASVAAVEVSEASEASETSGLVECTPRWRHGGTAIDTATASTSLTEGPGDEQRECDECGELRGCTSPSAVISETSSAETSSSISAKEIETSPSEIAGAKPNGAVCGTPPPAAAAAAA